MIHRVILFFFINLSLICFGQNKLEVEKTNTINTDDKTMIGFDNLSNNYFIKNNVLSKENNLQKWEYKNVVLGKISFVDLINPLKIVLYYKDFNTIILLDNQLNEIQKIELFNLDNSLNVSKTGMASQNQLWLYDNIDQQILLFDYTKNSFKKIGNPLIGSIKLLQSDYNNFYWIDDKNQVFTVNFFGQVSLMFTIPDFDKVQIIDLNYIIFKKNESIYLLNIQKKLTSKIEIVENSFENFYYCDQKLAIFTDQQITNYNIKLP